MRFFKTYFIFSVFALSVQITYCLTNDKNKFSSVFSDAEFPTLSRYSRNNTDYNMSNLNRSNDRSLVDVIATSNLYGTEYYNVTVSPNKTLTSPACPENSVLPVKGSAEEVNHSLTILLILFVLAICFLCIHFMLQTNFHYLPESIVVIFLGAMFGLLFKLFPKLMFGDLQKKEAFNPTTFFLFFLPPILYESGYNLNKGNFFKNFGSILVFAFYGTVISAAVIGSGLYSLGAAGFIYQLSFTESFAFGSIISAVDPVATVAIFHALDMEPILNMLVIGESILNDAVAIVLASSVWAVSGKEYAKVSAITHAIKTFLLTFFVSSAIGVGFALFAALLFKHVNLRKNPSVEFGMMLIFIYAPYCLAEGLQLSGIMAILCNGIVMSHYTHFNLSKVAQQIMQVTLRTMAFISETCVFAYLGMAMFSFELIFKPSFIAASIVLCMLGRAVSVFPLSYLVNLYREHRITQKMMFIMWFSGMRGAVAFALALRFEFEDEKRYIIITTTLLIVLFTTIVLGSCTLPFLKLLKVVLVTKEGEHSEICLSKTEKMGKTIEAEELSEDDQIDIFGAQVKGFMRIDRKILIPFFVRKSIHQTGSESEYSEDYQPPKKWYGNAHGSSGEDSGKSL